LAKRAARHAGNGDCHRAIAIWEQVLPLVPDDLLARRDIGMASSELGDFVKAKHYLSEALLVDYEDIGSLVALANIAVKQEDHGAAEAYAQKAVAAGPQNAWALNCLGAVLFYTGRHEEALSFLRAAIAFDPEFAPPYGAIACLSHQQGRHAEAEATLRDMFARARKQDIRSEPIFTQARQIYRKVQDSLAEM
jgi:Flp pilus assembly protein TadD